MEINKLTSTRLFLKIIQMRAVNTSSFSSPFSHFQALTGIAYFLNSSWYSSHFLRLDPKFSVRRIREKFGLDVLTTFHTKPCPFPYVLAFLRGNRIGEQIGQIFDRFSETDFIVTQNCVVEVSSLH